MCGSSSSSTRTEGHFKRNGTVIRANLQLLGVGYDADKGGDLKQSKVKLGARGYLQSGLFGSTRAQNLEQVLLPSTMSASDSRYMSWPELSLSRFEP